MTITGGGGGESGKFIEFPPRIRRTSLDKMGFISIFGSKDFFRPNVANEIDSARR